jgi:hypothetical protein
MDRIDWKNLGFLPDRRCKAPLDRERLAEKKHQRDKAKHCGRNHLSNQMRRQEAVQKRRSAEISTAKRNASFSRYKDAVRAYWLGLSDQHP